VPGTRVIIVGEIVEGVDAGRSTIVALALDRRIPDWCIASTTDRFADDTQRRDELAP